MVSATRIGRGPTAFNQGSNMSERKCLACGIRPAATDEDWPAICEECLDRAGEPVEPRARVVCVVDGGLSGILDRIEDDLVVVRTIEGEEAWLPQADVVAVLG